MRSPNFILILADDLGYGDLGCYGAPKIRTPNLDRMAAEGARFTDFYVGAPICTPSRAALLTGRYPFRSGLTTVLFPDSKGGLRRDETTLAELLRERGYATACIGKWHLGHLPEYLPTRHGFDRYYGIPYSNDMRPTPLLRDERVVEEPAEQELLTARYTEEAFRFIWESRDRPFFLYMPHTFPHVPLHASDRFRGTSPGGLYGDVAEELDWSVGEVLRAVAEQGLDESTLVIFTSDNGPWQEKGGEAGSAAPLRGAKFSVYEGGMREPFLARWPGRVPEGWVCREPASALDLLPTLLQLAGAEAPAGLELDGRDISGLLTERRSPGPFRFAFYRHERLEAIRWGRWKLHLARRERDGPRPPELYDLRADLGEAADLAAERPHLVRRMTRMAREIDRRVRRGAAPLQR